MPDRLFYKAARELAMNTVNHERDLRSRSWRMTRTALRNALGRTALRLGSTIQQAGWALLRPHPAP